MIYRKNLYGWEQWARVVFGLLLVGGAFYAFAAGVLAYGLACVGVVLAITGVVGFCPICAMVGRRPVDRQPV